MIVEKIGNKDKDYNLCVARVNEKETKAAILRDQIKKLQQDYTHLRNEASVDVTETKQENEATGKFDKDEQELIKQEQDLTNDLEELQVKNESVELTYEKVVENIRFFISKSDSLKKEEADSSRKERSLNTEEDIMEYYIDFLSLLKGVVDKTYSKMSKQNFLQMMQRKATDMNLNLDKKEASAKKRVSSLKPKLGLKKQKENKDDEEEEVNVEDEADQMCNDVLIEVLRGVI
jgi:hypothetical protein